MKFNDICQWISGEYGDTANFAVDDKCGLCAALGHHHAHASFEVYFVNIVFRSGYLQVQYLVEEAVRGGVEGHRPVRKHIFCWHCSWALPAAARQSPQCPSKQL